MYSTGFPFRTIICLMIIFLCNSFFYNIGASAGENLSFESEANVQYQALKSSVTVSLTSESADLDRLIKKADGIERQKSILAGEINAYKTQHTTYLNILLLPNTEIKDLEKTDSASRASLLNIDRRLLELKAEHNQVKQDRVRLEEQHQLNNTILTEIRTQNAGIPEAASLADQLQKLVIVLDKKKEAIDRFQVFYIAQIHQFEEIQTLFQDLGEKIETQIKEKKRRGLFVRNRALFSTSIGTKILDELRVVKKEILFIFSASFWKEEARIVWKSGESFLVLFVLLFSVTQILFVRLRRYCIFLQNQPDNQQLPRLRLTLLLLSRSLLLINITFFLFAYTLLRPASPFVSLVLFIFQILLFTRWGLDLMRFLPVVGYTRIPPRQVFMLQLLVHGIRFYALLYVLVAFILNSDSALLFIYRILFETGFVIWGLLFGNLIKKSRNGFGQPGKKQVYGNGISGFCLIIVIGGLLFETSGYGSLANYWYLSWGKSGVVILWGTLLFLLIREWDQAQRVMAEKDDTTIEKVEAPVRWLAAKTLQMALIGLFIVSLIIAWGGRQAFLLNLFKILTYTLTLGNMNINLLGCIYFILILFITNAAARFWKYIFQNKLLSRSGMEIGLQDSITTITVYLIWVIGVLISLHAIGLNTTSIAVALGALGIGLGFGLQNIFNNFLSGIILLFERPIQVGDDLEVNGTWGTVKKINVRSTVVQTYDNASLIIPNSELISAQVTNWSFKDKRLRRGITVGVAYGSDVELVRQTLLEVADKTPRVLKHPKPDVIFSDFGDNALIFKLRFWTNVSYFLVVETDVRFEIDRLFRERKVTIAFPQRDVHFFQGSQPTEETDQ